MAKTEIEQDLVSLLASGTDVVLGVTGLPPVMGLVHNLRKVLISNRREFLERKVLEFWKEFQNNKVDKTLLRQVYDNFRKEHGGDYFDEMLFNTIDKADSVKRTKMVSHLIILCSLGKIPMKDFGSVLFVLQNLTMSDLMLLEEAIELQHTLAKVEGDEFVAQTKIIESKIGMLTLLRFQACALAKTVSLYGRSSVPFINIEFANLVVKVIKYA